MSEGEKIADALLPLLQEYTLRLRSECEEYLKRRPLMLLAIGVIAAFFTLAIISSLKLGWKDIPRDLPDVVFMIMGGVGIAGIVLGTRYAFLYRQMDILKRHEIQTTAARLEKVVRLGSQLEDHAIEDLGRRMQLQLRLADGEAALGLVNAVVARGSLIRSIEIAGMKVRVAPEGGPATTANTENFRERHP